MFGHVNSENSLLDEVKARAINIYEKMSEVNSAREFLDKEMRLPETAGARKIAESVKSVQSGKCRCQNGVNCSKGFYVERVSGDKSVYCYNCISQYLTGDKIELVNEKVDYLGWGLSGLFEQDTPEESNCSTSSDEEVSSERKWLYSRHKILRKLRRTKPQVFQVNYALNKSEIAKTETDDPNLRRYMNMAKAIEDKGSESPFIRTIRQRDNTKEYDFYGGGNFDFSNEVHLKDKYSSTKFDFLTGLIHCYQRFLKKHPEERYPSVSELMIKSGQIICKDEEDIVARYYDVLYKKGGPILTDSTSVNIKPDVAKPKKIRKTQSHIDKSKSLIIQETIPPEELLRAKRTGILDLSNKSMVQVPGEVWLIGQKAVEIKHQMFSRITNPKRPKGTKLYKPLIYLNLSYNKLKILIPQGNCFNSLLHLCLNNNKIEDIPDEFGNFKCLQILNLESNSLKILPKSFCNLVSLKDLNLSRNRLFELPNSFGCLKKLKSIDLCWNKLTKLPDTIEDLESLNHLNVSHNKISTLPMDLCNMYSLIVLDISYNRIPELPMLIDMPKLLLVNAMGNLIKEFPNFAKSISLCEIRLDGNRIKCIVTDHLLDCPIVQLTLSYNKISCIPEDLYKIETIVLLDCTYNRLSCLPLSLARLKYLTCLRVEENHISNLHKDVLAGGSKKIIGELVRELLQYNGDNSTIDQARKDLAVLYVKGDACTVVPVTKSLKLDSAEVAKTRSFIRKRLELTTVPTEWVNIARDHKVVKVDLSKNKFRYVPAELKALNSSLNELILRENNIKTVPDFIGRMPQLTVLDLSFNHLDNLPLTMTTCRLTKLICRRNLFTMIPKVIFMIQTIEYLDFSENQIKELDVDGLRNLRKLYHLNVSKNEIKRLPSELGYLMNIKQLNVIGNLFKKPGLHILRGGTQVLLEYLKRHPTDNK